MNAATVSAVHPPMVTSLPNPLPDFPTRFQRPLPTACVTTRGAWLCHRCNGREYDPERPKSIRTFGTPLPASTTLCTLCQGQGALVNGEVLVDLWAAYDTPSRPLWTDSLPEGAVLAAVDVVARMRPPFPREAGQESWYRSPRAAVRLFEAWGPQALERAALRAIGRMFTAIGDDRLAPVEITLASRFAWPAEWARCNVVALFNYLEESGVNARNLHLATLDWPEGEGLQVVWPIVQGADGREGYDRTGDV